MKFALSLLSVVVLLAAGCETRRDQNVREEQLDTPSRADEVFWENHLSKLISSGMEKNLLQTALDSIKGGDRIHFEPRRGKHNVGLRRLDSDWELVVIMQDN